MIINSWNGGIKIVSQEEIDAQNNAKNAEQGQQKFDTCKNRSAEPVTKPKRLCCSTIKETGYECNLRQIFILNPGICATCTVYQKK